MEMIIFTILAGWAIIATIGMALISDTGRNRLMASEAEADRIRKERDEARKEKGAYRQRCASLQQRIVDLEFEYVNLQDAVSQSENYASNCKEKLDSCELERFKQAGEIAQALSLIPSEFKASDDLPKAVRTMVAHYTAEPAKQKA